MNIEEAKAMLGTEFEYYFEDGGHIRAYVKAFDPEIGLTCFSLGLEASDGYRFQPEDVGDDGACMIGVDLRLYPGDLQEALDKLKIIRDTGKYTQNQALYRQFFGCEGFTGCAFSK